MKFLIAGSRSDSKAHSWLTPILSGQPAEATSNDKGETRISFSPCFISAKPTSLIKGRPTVVISTVSQSQRSHHPSHPHPWLLAVVTSICETWSSTSKGSQYMSDQTASEKINLCHSHCTSYMIPETGMALLIREKCFLDNIYLKVISFTYNCFQFVILKGCHSEEGPKANNQSTALPGLGQ